MAKHNQATVLMLAMVISMISIWGPQINPLLAEPIVEPPFPQLFNQNNQNVNDRLIAKLVTQIISPVTGQITNQEEYVDLTLGKYALVVRDTKEVIYSSATESILLKYKPYTCDKFDLNDQILSGCDGISGLYGKHDARVFGAMGLWLEAERASKSFASTIKPGITTDLKETYNFWTYHIGEHRIYIYFNEALILEKIEIWDTSTNLLKTIMILSIEYTLDNYEDILEVPVGFGCSKFFEVQAQDWSRPEYGSDEKFYWRNYMWVNSHVKLEVTGTTPATLQSNQMIKETRLTDTLTVELAHMMSHKAITGVGNDLIMTKVKSKQQEIKTIINHQYGVGYHIDSRAGTCTMSHLEYKIFGAPKNTSNNDDTNKQEDEITTEDQLSEELVLKFANGLKLPLHKSTIRLLFSRDSFDTFTPVRKIKRPNSGGDPTLYLEYSICERPTIIWPYPATSARPGEKLIARIMATFKTTKMVKTNSNYNSGVLESLTIWVLSADKQDKILESYHMTVAELDRLTWSYLELDHYFDISEDCYLSDPTKRAGQDYAWMDLFYPISSRAMEALVDDEQQLRRAIYRTLFATDLLTTFNVPRLEVTFGDEGVNVRLLVLDLPPFELLFDTKKDSKLITGKQNSSETQRFVLPDERHCARMCQLHQCLTMSYCATTSECLISPNPARLVKAISVTRVNVFERYEDVSTSQGCITYSTSLPNVIRELRPMRLANLISTLNYPNYGQLELPEIPEKLTLPTVESGMSDAEHNYALKKFIKDVEKDLVRGKKLLPLCLNNYRGLSMVLPTRFSIEQNPLDEFGLDHTLGARIESNDLQLHDPSEIVQFFHAGLSGSRLDMDKAVLGSTEQHPKKLRSLSGVTYDQCALACLDSKCGVFSYCEHDEECVMSELATADAAKQASLFTADQRCLVSQRDYAQHFMKFADVDPPTGWFGNDLRVLTVNDCASRCVTDTSRNCRSFDYCFDSITNENRCYESEQRQPGADHQVSRADTIATLKCDHYERSYLAEFTAIELHSIKPDRMKELKTSSQYGKTTFECADICLNELADCSAFQFCYQPNSAGNRVAISYGQSCIMIQGKPSDDSKLEGAATEYVVDDEDPESVRLSKDNLRLNQGILHSDDNCHVFALKPNSIQAKFRSLAFGQTMTSHEKEQLAEELKSAGFVFSWLGLFMLALTLVVVSTLATSGLLWAREKNALVRYHMDRVQSALTRPLNRWNISR
uniref:Apple domain-containing protein n=1 Tax=Aceria tosichella TaxID=561515 RepID=A0A6G1S4F0_9ACAR